MKRYFVDEQGVSHEHPTGAYVRFYDVEEKLENAQARIDELKQQVEAAYRSGYYDGLLHGVMQSPNVDKAFDLYKSKEAAKEQERG